MDNITYYCQKDNIEPKVISQLEEITQRHNVSNINVYPDIHYCAEKIYLLDWNLNRQMYSIHYQWEKILGVVLRL